MSTSVTDQIKVTEEQTKEAKQMWEDPQMILRLIDLMFLNEDPGKVIYS